MKILHTSDWHLGKKLGNWSRLEEQKEILDEIIEICRIEEPDLILLSGDLYDSWNPPHEAIELLYRSLHRMTGGGKRIILALAGNHDAPEHVEAPDALARECGIFFMGYPESQPEDISLDSGLSASFPDPGMVLFKGLPGVREEVRIICTPYASETRMRRYLDVENKEDALRTVLTKRWKNLATKYFNDQGINLMAAHLFMGSRSELLAEEEPEGEKSILHPGGLEQIYTESLPGECQYMALGHLHRGFPVASSPVPAVYSGSPGAYSLSEKSEGKSVVLITVQPGGKAKYRFHPLQSPWPLYRKTFSSADEAVTWLQEHPRGYVEITMKTEEYLRGAEKQKILQSHERILAIIPELKNKGGEEIFKKRNFSGKSIREVFDEYYRSSRQNTPPGEELMNLLDEILSGQDS
ncbi:exonuclease subunit SbcD [Oceanispirochaeta crateris]|uniref:Nuclease SbcCD subunit D n=1 Tax=Oceanispirochaeta crateris TaxID=2518645 RepID=A0A5C1QN74_9SPIO|nr:exonuclease subunit SbcD [Oceanispirochaeta crateris]QEN09131.1 exonuclease subunit SbcD [Oceanispirochaeta crateris]